MRARVRRLLAGALVLQAAVACSVLTDYTVAGKAPPVVEPDGSVDATTTTDAPVTDGPIADADASDDGGPVCAENPCILQASATGSVSCALTVSGEVWCWGRNRNGVVGAVTDGSFPTPQKVAFDGTTAIDQIAVNDWGRHQTTACARRAGTVECWGADGTERRLGRGGAEAGTFVRTPAPVPNVAGATDIALSDQRSCAIVNGGVVCWGKDYANDVTLAVPVATPKPASRIYGGHAHHVVILDDGQIAVDGYPYISKETWGPDGGNGAGPGQSGYVITAGIGDVADVHTPGSFVCVLTKAGKVSCWGRNNNGQLGRGNTSAFTQTPLEVSLPMPAKRIGGGPNHTCVVLADESVYCWGRNSSGNDFDGTSSPRGVIGALPDGSIEPIVTLPRKLEGIPGNDPVRGITGGYDHTCVWTRSGAVYCWGGNRSGQLGLGKYGITTDDTPHPIPQKVQF